MFTRRFILAAAAYGACLSPCGALPFSAAGRFGDAASRLRALVPAPESAREIGRIYLAGRTGEVGAGTLTDLILSSMSLDEGTIVALDKQALSARLTSRVRADFAKGLTVEIGGWILSRTETRLCALWTETRA
jgi:hypothetical protein